MKFEATFTKTYTSRYAASINHNWLCFTDMPSMVFMVLVYLKGNSVISKKDIHLIKNWLKK